MRKVAVTMFFGMFVGIAVWVISDVLAMKIKMFGAILAFFLFSYACLSGAKNKEQNPTTTKKEGV